MKLFASILFAFIALSASAFDSDVWLLKRGEQTGKAMALKKRYAEFAAKATEPAENVAVPVESHPNGSVKTSVFAKKAQFFLESGLIWGEEVVVRELKEDGSLLARIDAKNCIVDRVNKCGWAQGMVKAVYDGTTLEGEGVYLSFADEFVVITDNAKISSAKFDVGAKAKKSEVPTVLTSKRADYDRGAGVVMFEERVFLDNPEYKFASDSLFAFLKGTNELKRVVAIGNVVVTNGHNRGSCDRASYFRSTGKITMYASGGGRKAMLEDISGGDQGNRLEGDRISFWIDSEQVEVENSRITVDAGGKLKL